MSVFRVEKTKDFTIMSNHHLKNKSLTLKSKGLLSLMSRIVPTPIPTYDNYYAINHQGLPMRYIYHIKRDELLNDMIEKIVKIVKIVN